jgi:hypothetical protein
MKIGVDVSGLKEIEARLRGLQEKKIAVAKVAALNDAAREAYEASRREMGKVFDKPTPWVMGGVRYTKANREKPESSVDFDKWGNKYGVTVENVLRANIYSGQRKHKRHEIALQRIGVLPSGMAIVPGSAAQIDAYGNMSGGQIRQIQAYFRAAEMTAGFTANSTDKTRAKLARDNKRTGARGFAYFAIQKPHGKLLPGIYQRIKTGFGYAVKPVMIFVRVPRYKKTFDFYGVSDKAARMQFIKSFERYLDGLLKERGL